MKREAYWRDMVKAYQESGLTPGIFCKNQGISDASLRLYRRKFGQEKSLLVKDKLGFEPIVITPTLKTQEKHFLVIQLPNQIRCEIEILSIEHQMEVLKGLVALC